MGRKIDLAKVLASLNTLCLKCGYSIPPNETQRLNFTEMKCPKCQAIFVAGAAET
jgi:ribosomal protein S27AE